MSNLSLTARFVAKAAEIMPHMDDLQELPEWVSNAGHIDEYFGRRSELLLGMAVVILALIDREDRA